MNLTLSSTYLLYGYMEKAVDGIKSTKPFQQAVLFFWGKTVPQAMSFWEMTVIRRGRGIFILQVKIKVLTKSSK